MFGYEQREKKAQLHTDALAEECMRFMDASDDSPTLVQKYMYNSASLVNI